MAGLIVLSVFFGFATVFMIFAFVHLRRESRANRKPAERLRRLEKYWWP
jgi:hypothetical protein